jgi:CRP-like cAMP-binding protein
MQSGSDSNYLLASLPNAARLHLLANCDLVELTIADVLSHPGDRMEYVYFPTGGVISLVKPLDGEGNLEIGLVGNEGMLGVTLVLGVDVAQFRAQVQKAGSALRMAAPSFIDELEQSPALKREVKRYLYVSFSQLVQSSACNRFHLIEERLARLLLMLRDRAHSDSFHVTHELLAQMLGVRRVGVTKAAGSLHRKKLISYSRGDIRIDDIQGLEQASCPCYRADKETYDRILQCPA